MSGNFVLAHLDLRGRRGRCLVPPPPRRGDRHRPCLPGRDAAVALHQRTTSHPRHPRPGRLVCARSPGHRPGGVAGVVRTISSPDPTRQSIWPVACGPWLPPCSSSGRFRSSSVGTIWWVPARTHRTSRLPLRADAHSSRHARRRRGFRLHVMDSLFTGHQARILAFTDTQTTCYVSGCWPGWLRTMPVSCCSEISTNPGCRRTVDHELPPRAHGRCSFSGLTRIRPRYRAPRSRYRTSRSTGPDRSATASQRGAGSPSRFSSGIGRARRRSPR